MGYAKLIAGLVLVATLLSGWAYWKHLTGSIEKLEGTVVELQTKNKTLTDQLVEVTTAKDELEKKAASAQDASKSLEVELKKRKTAIRYIEVPQACPDAVQWLVDEVTR
jgi:preprotein translocase subunit SecF